MLVRSVWPNGTTFFKDREVNFRDHVADVPAHVAKEMLAAGQYTLQPKKWRELKDCRSFLMIRGSGLGDVMMCHPIRRHLRTLNKKMKISFLTSVEFAPVARHDPTVDRFVRKSDLRKGGFDHIVNLNNCEFKNIFPYFHKVDLLAHEMGLPAIKDKTLFYQVDKEERRWAKRKLGKRKCVGVVLKSTCSTKHFGGPKYRHILQYLLRKGYTPIIFDKSKRRFEGLQEQLVSACGKYTIRQCAALIEQCKVVITPDTGFLHLAVAVGTPTVAYFGSIGHETVITPGNVEIIHAKLECYPCNSFKCRLGNKKCLQLLEPKLIASRALAIRKD